MDTERLRINKPANPGANATVPLYDDTTIEATTLPTDRGSRLNFILTWW